jgi:lambda repressor-like predicted transcriptional regulator/GNAT superfamily N-acetyltransferase
MDQTLTLRPFENADYPALAAFLTQLHPDEPKLAADLQRFDEGRLPGEHHARTLAWRADRLVGQVETERSRQFTRPGWYGLHVRAADAELRQHLLHLGLDTLRPLSPSTLHTTLSEPWPEYSWLLAQGWREHERMWLSHLDLNSFEPGRFEERKQRSKAAGIKVKTLAELGWDDSELMQRRYYDLIVELLGDVPTTDPVDPWPFEVWKQRLLGAPDFTPAGPLLAVQEGEWIGVTELYTPYVAVPGMIRQGLTGVRRGWRGQGAAWALKLAGAERAKAQGLTGIRTGNHTVNAEMLGINAALGFVREPARVTLIRDWTP